MSIGWLRTRQIPGRHRSLALVAASGAGALLMAMTGSPALAAPTAASVASASARSAGSGPAATARAAARSAGVVTMTASAAPGSHVISTVRVSASQCAAMRRAVAASRPGAARMAHCVIGVGLAAVSAVPTRKCGKTGRWTTCYDKGTLCFGDRPLWGGPNHSFSCRGEAYVSVDGRWKYRTPHNHKVFLLGQVLCPDAFFEGNVQETFCGKRNNGHPILTMECLFNWSGTIGPVTGGGNGYIAIYAHYNGKVTLYGAWNSQ
jgi:hypothetical protein